MTIRIARDVVFSRARIGWNHGKGPMQEAALKLDAYLPLVPSREPAPALVMAFGGAFHRGTKEDDSFSDGVGRSTAVAEYCRRFAALGMPSFSVQYRLAQVDPEPGRDPVLTQPDAIPMSRINPVRVELGLPPVGARQMAGIMEAAFEDVGHAVRFVKANAASWGVDPGRIVLGGFSAGGRCAMYAAYGKRVGVAGVVSISGPLVPADAAAYLARGGDLPPLQLISGERDLDYVCRFVPEIERQFRAAGRPVAWSMVPGATHFFPAEAVTSDGRPVIDVMRSSIEGWVGRL
ncbi:MAG: alpha/beta hydrolase [Hyphomicrobiaceae bacterium]|nr:alpha/beta hydrolase [Hyphomicrobiaceae bacterium]